MDQKISAHQSGRTGGTLGYSDGHASSSSNPRSACKSKSSPPPPSAVGWDRYENAGNAFLFSYLGADRLRMVVPVPHGADGDPSRPYAVEYTVDRTGLDGVLSLDGTRIEIALALMPVATLLEAGITPGPHQQTARSLLRQVCNLCCTARAAGAYLLQRRVAHLLGPEAEEPDLVTKWKKEAAGVVLQ